MNFETPSVLDPVEQLRESARLLRRLHQDASENNRSSTNRSASPPERSPQRAPPPHYTSTAQPLHQRTTEPLEAVSTRREAREPAFPYVSPSPKEALPTYLNFRSTEHVGNFIERKAQDKVFGSPLPPAPSYFSPARHHKQGGAAFHATPLGTPTQQHEWAKLRRMLSASGTLPPRQYESGTSPRRSPARSPRMDAGRYPSRGMRPSPLPPEQERLHWEQQLQHRDIQFTNALSPEDRDFYSSFEALCIHEKEQLKAELRRLRFAKQLF